MVSHAPAAVAFAAIVGAAPSIFLLVFFYLKDRYEPEPRGHVALAFAKGARWRRCRRTAPRGPWRARSATSGWRSAACPRAPS
ncbi:MAG TPA: hypothetical protein VGH63_09305, partial [Polyangia bacterium]